jgi:pyruvate-formate lyase-activating enzyme
MPRAKKHIYSSARRFINEYPELTTLVIKHYKENQYAINDIARIISQKYKVTLRADFVTPMMDLKDIPRRTHKQVNTMMSKKLKGHGYNT